MDIRSKIRDKIEPRIYADIATLTDENGKTYIEVSANGADIPYSFDGRYYVRNVSSDEQASNEILRKMLATSDYDIIRQKTSPKQDLTFNLYLLYWPVLVNIQLILKSFTETMECLPEKESLILTHTFFLTIMMFQ